MQILVFGFLLGVVVSNLAWGIALKLRNRKIIQSEKFIIFGHPGTGMTYSLIIPKIDEIEK